MRREGLHVLQQLTYNIGRDKELVQLWSGSSYVVPLHQLYEGLLAEEWVVHLQCSQPQRHPFNLPCNA